MAFGNNQSNNRTELSMNTKGIQFYNSEPVVGSALVTGYWNTCTTLKICPLLPEKDRSQTRVFNYETFVNAALVPEKLMSLYIGIKDNILPILFGDSASYDFKAIGVPTGNGYVEISNGEKHNLEKNNIVLTIYGKVDNDGTCSEYLSYIFNKAPYYYDYDNKSGKIESLKTEIEFLMFVNIVKESIKASTNAIAHNIRNVNKYVNEHSTNDIKSIMERLGIESKKGSNNGGSNFSSSKFFNNKPSSPQSSEGLDEREIVNQELSSEEDRLPM